jgi:protoheme IX farnesyltransferase
VKAAGLERLHFGELLEVTKPRLVLLVLWTVTVGFLLASPGPLDLFLLVKTFLGTALIAGGAMALNQFLERDVDAKMKRTENRPLPSGRVAPEPVLWFGILLSVAGLSLLTFGVNLLTGLLSGLTVALYLFVYTPLKLKSPVCTLVGAIPGAIPPVLGWTAVQGELSPTPWLLFLIVLFWQLPHFLAISWAMRDDYTEAGFQILAVIDSTGKRVGKEMVSYTAALLPVTLLPTLVGATGWIYFWGALLLGVWFFGLSLKTASELDRRARHFFRASIFYLGVLLLLMILDKKPI